MKKQNTLQRQKILFIRYQQSDISTDSINLNNSLQNSRRENYFIQKIQIAINANMSNEDFGILKLCKIVGISRSQLHNKIKATTGISTSHFINNIRLEKAQTLLKTTDWNISEIAYAVGFNSPSYFSTAYMKKYGHRPSYIRKPLTI